MTQTPSIAIVGGGPSGLTFARLLEQSGITDYVVFERDESATPGPGQQGGTLDLHVSSGQFALKRAGLFEKFSEELARWDASRTHILDPAGNTVVRWGADRDDPSSKPEIDRLQLRQLLLDSIPAYKIRWGHGVKSIERIDENAGDGNDARKGNGCVIHFLNGTSASGFQLIVGADGAWSKVRPVITQAKPLYSGVTFVEGRISKNNPTYAAADDLAGPGSFIAIGGTKMLNAHQVANGSYRVYFGLTVPETFYQDYFQKGSKDAISGHTGDRTEEIRSLLLTSDDYYTAWTPSLKTFIESAEGSFRPWPLYNLDPDAVNWSRSSAPGVTLLGDAAHLSTPLVGEGVNCGMHDAVQLAECIIKECGSNTSLADDKASTKLETALAAYEDSMFARGQDLIRRSKSSGEILFAENAAEKFLEFISSASKGKPNEE